MVRSRLAVLMLFAAAVLLLAACDNGDSGGATVTFHETPAATEPAGGDTPAPSDEPATPTNDDPDGQPTETATPRTWEAILPCGDILVPADKEHALAPECAPDDLVLLPSEVSYGGDRYLRAEAAAALLEMLDAAAAEGWALYVISAYRSYNDQVATFNQHVELLGEAQAERVSARPGHSEHQLGTTADLTSASAGFELVEAFGETDEGRWVAENSWRYGFIISYPDGSEPVTGYSYEPWHVRYLGVETAAAARESGLTLHEFLLAR